MTYLDSTWKWTNRLEKYYVQERWKNCTHLFWRKMTSGRNGAQWVDPTRGIRQDRGQLEVGEEWYCVFPRPEWETQNIHTHIHTQSYQKTETALLSTLEFMGFSVKWVSESVSWSFLFQKWQIWNVVVVITEYTSHSPAKTNKQTKTKRTHKPHQTPHTQPKPSNPILRFNVISHKMRIRT